MGWPSDFTLRGETVLPRCRYRDMSRERGHVPDERTGHRSDGIDINQFHRRSQRPELKDGFPYSPSRHLPDLDALILAIGSYFDRHNQSPKVFLWTARAADILEQVKRACRTLNKRQSA
jgi:hypothetical protein